MAAGSRKFLFDLVNSLTKQEAKQVVDYLNGIGTQHSKWQLELFEAMRSARSASNDNLVLRLKTAELKKYLAYHKDALKAHILQVLAQHVDPWDRDRNTILQRFFQLKAIYRKGFVDEAVLQAEKLLADMDENYHAELKLFILNECMRLSKVTATSHAASVVETWRSQRPKIIQVLSDESKLESISNRVFQLYSKYGRARDSAIWSELTELLSDPLLSGAEEGTLIALHYRSQALFFWSQYKEDFNIAIGILERSLAVWESHETHILYRPNVYTGIILNLLNCYAVVTDWQSFDNLYSKALEVRLPSQADSNGLRCRLISTRILSLINRKRSEEAADMEKEVILRWNDFERTVSKSSLTHLGHIIGSTMFLLGRDKKAQKWFGMLQSLKSDSRHDLIGIAHLLQLLIAVQQHDLPLIELQLRNVKAFYRKHPELDHFATLTVNHIEEWLQLPSRSKTVNFKIWTSAMQALNASGRNDAFMIGKEEVRLWFESQLTGRSINAIWKDSN